jgi:5-methyltetrahydrofolate--homocysteine methyltransferase
MTLFKEDIKEAKERLTAWWDHELVDRPCIAYYCLRKGGNMSPENLLEYFDPWYLAQSWDDIETCLNEFERISNSIEFGGESIPRFFPNYGPGIMAAVLGIEPQFKARTVWFNKITPLHEMTAVLERAQINMNNPWYARLVQITKFAAERAGKEYCIAMTDLGGVLDILSSFLGPEKLILAMTQYPAIIDACRAIILEKLTKVYTELQTIIEKYSEGCNSWLNFWCPKRWYPLQSDFSYMLSPRWFKRFVLPDIITQADQLNYAIYHLDGPFQLNHLDDLLAIPAITGIQWVPGAQESPKCNEKWMPIYKKVQAAGKSVVIDNFEDPKFLSHFYKELDAKRLLVNLIALDPIRIKFDLPAFIGGQEGLGDYKVFRRSFRKH